MLDVLRIRTSSRPRAAPVAAVLQTHALSSDMLECVDLTSFLSPKLTAAVTSPAFCDVIDNAEMFSLASSALLEPREDHSGGFVSLDESVFSSCYAATCADHVRTPSVRNRHLLMFV